MDRSKNGKHSIAVKIYANGKNKYKTLPFKVLSSDWLTGKERTKNNPQLNKFLDELSSKFNLVLIENTGNLDVNAIERYLFGKEESRTTYDYIKNFVNDKKAQKDVKSNTISRYARVLSVLHSFLIKTNQEGLLLVDFKLEHIHQFDNFIKSHILVNGSQLGRNTLNKYHSILRTMLIQAFHEGKLLGNPYKLFKLKSKPTHRQFLSDSELWLIRNTPCDVSKCEKARYIYLLSCATGLRFSDSQGLCLSNLKRNSNGEVYLSFISRKADKQQEIPLLDDAIAIIAEIAEKFSEELTITGRLLPKISNQKFNKYLKEVASTIGIRKEITHHTARHTFATFMLNRGVSPQALQVLLGHSNLRETMIYAKITPGYLRSEVNKGNTDTYLTAI